MTDVSQFTQLRAEPRELWQWAKDTYSKGRSVQEILLGIYGTDLPPEVYAFLRTWPRELTLPVERFFHPWAILALASPHGAERELKDVYAKLERAEFEDNSDFLPLMSLHAGDVIYDGHIVGYSLEHLRRLDSSIFGHAEGEPSSGVERLGGSLLHVLREWVTDYHRLEKEQFEASENQRRASDVGVKRAAQWLKELEKLQRKVAQG